MSKTSAPSRRQLITRRFLRNRLAIAGLVVLVLLFLAAFVLPHFLQWDYQELDTAAARQGPTWSHPFGTNQIGQDVLAQTMRGLQKSLLIGLVVALASAAIAAVVGAVAGYLGGWTDRTIMWIVDLLLVVPSLMIVAIFTPRTKGANSIILLIVLLSVFGWMITARIVRGMTLTLRDREFVRAAHYMGVPTWRIILSHILPNVASILIIDATLNVGNAVLAETSLSYLGFGVQAPDVSLGSLINQGKDSIQVYPWLFMFAGGLLVLTVLAANVVGDGLRDAFDPSSNRARRRSVDKTVTAGLADTPASGVVK